MVNTEGTNFINSLNNKEKRSSAIIYSNLIASSYMYLSDKYYEGRMENCWQSQIIHRNGQLLNQAVVEVSK